MKNGKRLNKKQKIAIKAAGLNPDNWLVYKIDNDGFNIVHRITPSTRKIYS